MVSLFPKSSAVVISSIICQHSLPSFVKPQSEHFHTFILASCLANPCCRDLTSPSFWMFQLQGPLHRFKRGLHGRHSDFFYVSNSGIVHDVSRPPIFYSIDALHFGSHMRWNFFQKHISKPDIKICYKIHCWRKLPLQLFFWCGCRVREQNSLTVRKQWRSLT